MHDNKPSRDRSWPEKFRDAFHGVREGVQGQSSFFVHFFVAALVIVAAVVLKIDNPVEWGLLLLCITVVLTAEMFNSALESIVRSITNQVDPRLGSALDIGSAAVLTASIGAAITGTIIFLNRLAMLLGWW